MLNDRGDIFGRGAGHRSLERRIVDLVEAVRGWHVGSNTTLSANMSFFVFNKLSWRRGFSAGNASFLRHQIQALTY